MRRTAAILVLPLLAILASSCAPVEGPEVGAIVRALVGVAVHESHPARSAATPVALQAERAPATEPASPTATMTALAQAPVVAPASTVIQFAQPSGLVASDPSVPTPYAWPTTTPPPTPTDPPTSTPDPFGSAGAPVRVQVPAIGVDAVVEEVGVTADRAMGVPSGWMNVGWYVHGFRPGEIGNAVMAGHLDTNTGGPAVFWELGRLAPGDEIVVDYSSGMRYVFVVQGSQVYDHDAEGPIIDQIFGPALTANLNLITCDGAWDRGMATYTKRLVVFSTLAPDRTVRAEGAGSYE